MVIVSIYNAGLGAIQALNFPEVDQILNEDSINRSLVVAMIRKKIN